MTCFSLGKGRRLTDHRDAGLAVFRLPGPAEAPGRTGQACAPTSMASAVSSLEAPLAASPPTCTDGVMERQRQAVIT